MSSTVATPASAIRIADNRYGTSSALTTKPERSPQRTTFLPSTSLANCSVRAAASGEVTSVLTSSTSGSTGTGLKKCRPSTRLGFCVAAAIFMIGMLDVFDASTASGSVITLSSSAKILRLDGFVLDDGLDDQLAVGQVGQVGGERQPRERRIAIVFAQLAFGRRTLQRLGDAACGPRSPARRSARRRPRPRRPWPTPRRYPNPSARRRSRRPVQCSLCSLHSPHHSVRPRPGFRGGA